MSHRGETNSSHVGGGSCSYATLSYYNNGSQGLNPPVPKGNVSGSYIVPVYGAPGYNTLTHGEGCCAGYPGIEAAYGPDSLKCNTKYSQMHCNGGSGHGGSGHGGSGHGSRR
jgi:hypothetical protein